MKDSLDSYINQDILNQPKVVYDNMTLEELSDKLDRSLNSDISGYGNFIASFV